MDFRRKHNRLAGYDYSSNGMYFITICTDGKACIFGAVRCAEIGQGARVLLSDTGKRVREEIERIPKVFPGIAVRHFMVMPNHVHMLIEIRGSEISLSSVINSFKGRVTRGAKRRIWQRSFHDHIVRDTEDYWRIWEYIDGNPGKWSEDRYYVP